MIPPVTADLHAAVATRLRGVGQRFTTQRQGLVAVLERARKPLSTAEIVRARTGPQSSVYRNLAVLEQAGVVRRVITDEGFARFELTEELTEHHHHLICSNCGKTSRSRRTWSPRWTARPTGSPSAAGSRRSAITAWT
jgi:Fe2+ or Zn2+ uptake regulation protein